MNMAMDTDITPDTDKDKAMDTERDMDTKRDMDTNRGMDTNRDIESDNNLSYAVVPAASLHHLQPFPTGLQPRSTGINTNH